jgi:hypothetical protein
MKRVVLLVAALLSLFLPARADTIYVRKISRNANLFRHTKPE